MNVDFTPEQELFVQQAIQSGRIGRPEDAAQEAFALWAERERTKHRSERTKAPSMAASILELRQGVRLPDGVSIQDLIGEGRD